jgi:hypothetical protein
MVGCRSVEQILLFLLVNETCYAHQLHRTLSVSLTPIQKGLKRLEKGNVLKSKQEGKRKIYCFNEAFPLMDELEMMLKKTYHLLPVRERQRYHHAYESKLQPRKTSKELLSLVWDRMKKVERMTMIASTRSKAAGLWERKGNGFIEMEHEGHIITFYEKGTWSDEKGFSLNYSNSYRWTWNWREETLSLEHLRMGEGNPVFLFDLHATDHHMLESLHPHLCGDDSYFGWLKYHPLYLQLHIRTIGPRKNEKIETVYT